MAPDIELVIQLQRVDNRISQLEREIAALPGHITEIERMLVSNVRQLEADQAALAANQKERKKLEGGVQSFEEKISKLKNQMLEARTNEQYRAFQHEIGYGEDEIRKAEDRILDLMADSESLDENVGQAAEALGHEKKHVEREKKVVREQTAANQKLLEQCRSERQGVATTLSPKIYSTYERLWKRYHGAVLAEGVHGRCSACNIALRPQYYQDLKQATEPMVCESCGRLLFYNPAADIQAEAEAPSSAPSPDSRP